MKKKIRMGIIGCGNIATWHIKGIMDSPDMIVAALCDILPKKLDEKMELSGVSRDSCYSNYIEMMESGKIDAVSICTPNKLHFQMVMDAIRLGIPYAVEKPLCGSQDEARTLVEETEKKNLPNMICFSYRFKAAARYARDLILSGQLGTIYHIGGEYLQAWGLPNAVDGKLTPRNWRFTKEQSITGALGDLGSHLIDLFRFMTGREFTRISADMDTFIHKRPMPDGVGDGAVDVDDYINIVGQMQGPIAANLSITRYAYGRGNYQRVEVYGDKGAIRYTLEDSDRLEINMGNAPMRTAHIWCAVPVLPIYNSSQMQSFADIVNGCGDGMAAGIRDGLRSQQLIDSAVNAAESGNRQHIV
jgi:predicted dehydrogenase